MQHSRQTLLSRMQSEDSSPAEEIGGEILAALNEQFHDAPDRTIAILGGAYLDGLLTKLLTGIFKEKEKHAELLATGKPLSEYALKVKVAYAFSLITEDQFRDLHTIGRVRNRFAHEFTIESFDSDRVRDLCGNLRHPKMLISEARVLLGPDYGKAMADFLTQEASTPREKFRTAVIALVGSLLRRIHYLRGDVPQWFSKPPG